MLILLYFAREIHYRGRVNENERLLQALRARGDVFKDGNITHEDVMAFVNYKTPREEK